MPRLLLADDSRTTEQLLRLALEPEGFQVIARPDGPSAWAAVLAQDVDLVLADVALPGIDGYELCRRIQAEPATVRFPVVLLGSAGAPVDAARALMSGCREWLVKPLDADVLVGVVNRLTQPAPETDADSKQSSADRPIPLTLDQCRTRLSWLPDLEHRPSAAPAAAPAVATATDEQALVEAVVGRLNSVLPELVRQAVKDTLNVPLP